MKLEVVEWKEGKVLTNKAKVFLCVLFMVNVPSMLSQQ